MDEMAEQIVDDQGAEIVALAEFLRQDRPHPPRVLARADAVE